MQPTTQSQEHEIESLRRELERMRVFASREHGIVEALLRHSPHGIIVSDAAGSLILQNPAAEKIWAGSATANDIQGWSRYRAFHPDGRPFQGTDWPMSRCLESGVTVEAQELQIQRFDGTFGVLIGSCAPIVGPDGRVEGAIAIFADVSQLKASERERNSLSLDLAQANQRAASLRDAIASVAQAATIEDIAKVVVDRARAIAGGTGCRLYLIAMDEPVLRLAASNGLEPAPPQLTIAEAIDHSSPQLVSLALRTFDRTIGALFVDLGAPNAFQHMDQELLRTLIAQCVPAIERALLFENERMLRQRAESQREALRMLAEASTLLASSLDYQSTLERVARICVPFVADWSAIDIIDHGTLRRIAIHHPHPAKIELARQLEIKYPTPVDAPHGAPHVIRTGELEWVPSIPDDLLERVARSPEHLAIIRGLGLRSYIVLPLKARGEVVGAWTLVFAESDRRYGAEEVELAQELARRASVAIDNARLYRESQHREREFRLLAETMPQMVWTGRADGYIDYCNKNWIEFTGLDLVETQGSGWAAALHPEDLDRTVARWMHSVTSGEDYEVVYRFRRASDGAFRWFIGRAAALRDESGQIVRWFGTCTDIDDQRRAEREIETYAHALETINRVGALLAAELKLEDLVQAVTDATTALCGAQFGAFFYNVVDQRGETYMLHTLSGAPKEAFAHFPMPRNTQIFAPTFAGEGIVRLDDVTKDPRFGKNSPHFGLPAGHPPVKSYLAVPVISRSGSVIGGLFFGHASPGVFTARAETLVTGLATQAAVAIDNVRLFEDAQRLIRELERTNADLDQFAYVASHDLKAPLRGIASLSEWLEEDLGANLTETGRMQMDLLRGRVRRMESLIDGVLSYSRIGRTKSKPERIDVAVLLNEVIELLGPVSAKIEIPKHLPVLLAERIPLQQVFLNLLGNAVKHAAKKEPHVQVSCTEHLGHWQFSVADDGPGIAPEFHDRIWGIFQTLEARDRVESTGIGLAIVKKIVETYGGRAWLESRIGEGATFFFTWPK